MRLRVRIMTIMARTRRIPTPPTALPQGPAINSAVGSVGTSVAGVVSAAAELAPRSPAIVKVVFPRVECPSEEVIWKPMVYSSGVSVAVSGIASVTFRPSTVGSPVTSTSPLLLLMAMVLNPCLGSPENSRVTVVGALASTSPSAGDPPTTASWACATVVVIAQKHPSKTAASRRFMFVDATLVPIPLVCPFHSSMRSTAFNQLRASKLNVNP